MGKRSTARKLTMQLLYEAEIKNAESVADIVDQFLEENAAQYIDETTDRAVALARQVFEHRDAFNETIKTYSKEWDIDRIAPLDKVLMWIALYEIEYEKTPKNIVLNEVIELAKRFSTDDSYRFLNGILGHYVDEKCLPESSNPSGD